MNAIYEVNKDVVRKIEERLQAAKDRGQTRAFFPIFDFPINVGILNHFEARGYITAPRLTPPSGWFFHWRENDDT